MWATTQQNLQNDLCAQWRLRSAWASAQTRIRLCGWKPSFCRFCFACAHMNHLMTKPAKWIVPPAKTQISLVIHPVRSESSQCAQWVAEDPISSSCGQRRLPPRLIWVFAQGAKAILLVLSWGGSVISLLAVLSYILCPCTSIWTSSIEILVPSKMNTMILKHIQ